MANQWRRSCVFSWCLSNLLSSSNTNKSASPNSSCQLQLLTHTQWHLGGESIPQLNTKHAAGFFEGSVWGEENMLVETGGTVDWDDVFFVLSCSQLLLYDLLTFARSSLYCQRSVRGQLALRATHNFKIIPSKECCSNNLVTKCFWSLLSLLLSPLCR